jgi:hypothetical protein
VTRDQLRWVVFLANERVAATIAIRDSQKNQA